MFLSEELQNKWQPVLEHPELEAIKDPYKKAVTAVILENQQREMAAAAQQLNETAPSVAAPTNLTGGVQNFDPILISLVRRALPNLIAYDVAGVQPMTGPTGLIFAMRAKYNAQGTPGSLDANEAFFNEANTIFSGTRSSINPFGFANSTTGDTSTNPVASLTANAFTTGVGMSTSAAEALGATAETAFNQMAFSIEKVTVTAKSRALKAEYSLELAQDLKAIHGLDAETEIGRAHV